jgi:putative lipoprotein
MKTYMLFALIIVALLLVACGAEAPPSGTGPSEDVIRATFVCPDGTQIEAAFDNAAGTVTISLADDTLTLPQVESASGARYSDGTTTFWNKGDEALVEVDGQIVHQNCVTED